MLALVGRRLAGAVAICLGLTVVLFVLRHLSATDPVRVLVGPSASTAQVDAMRHQLGYDLPLYAQWWHYVTGAATGDLQTSLRTRRPVGTDIAQFLPASLELAMFSCLIAAGLALLLGVSTAGRWRGAGLLNTVLLAIASAPAFLLTLFGIMVFYRNLGWLPATGRSSIADLPGGPTGLLTVDGLLAGRPEVTLDALRHLIMPAVCVALLPAIAVGRTLRSSLTTALESDHIRTAKAKGLSRRAILLHHGLRNSATTPLSMAGLQLGSVFASLVVVETVFAWPGLGLYLSQSIPASDFPAIAGTTLLLAVAYVAVNTAVDVTQAVLDPRLAR
jgi:peptide/nickel transport system permease protein